MYSRPYIAEHRRPESREERRVEKNQARDVRGTHTSTQPVSTRVGPYHHRALSVIAQLS